MIDFAKITVVGGKGGNGVVSFLHFPGMRHGRPDGGDGGKGGDVYLSATESLNTLEPFRYIKHYQAKDGGRGGENHKKGADGEDLYIQVPTGTVIFDRKTDQQLADLTAPDDLILAVKGGVGGKGNSRFKSAQNRSPKIAEEGKDGEQQDLILELKLIADVGIIGLPSAGKSTLLSVLTNSRPQIADYPFTTLEPNLGVMEVNNTKTQQPRQLVLADIPGLIEGASKGKGLGDEFLRHIQRTKILVHLIDASTNSDKWQDFQIIKKELKDYGFNLHKKKQILVLSKIDLANPDNLNNWKKVFSKHRIKVLVISAATHQGLEELKREIVRKL